MSFGEKIIQLREEKGFNRNQLSLAIGLNNSLLFNIENGNNNPSYEIIIKLCKFFNVSADYLLGLKNERN